MLGEATGYILDVSRRIGDEISMEINQSYGGGGNSYADMTGIARRNFEKQPLKVTNMGVAPTDLDP